MKKTAILFTILLIGVKCFAFDDYDEDSVSMGEAFQMVLIGGGIMLVGYVIGQISFLKGLGTVVIGIGGFLAIISLAMVVITIVTEVVNVAIKVALVVAVIVGAGYIIYSIYKAIIGKKDPQPGSQTERKS